MKYNWTVTIAVNYARALLFYSIVRIVLEVYHLMCSATAEQNFLCFSRTSEKSILTVWYVHRCQKV